MINNNEEKEDMIVQSDTEVVVTSVHGSFFKVHPALAEVFPCRCCWGRK
ncbi:hypothetical protein [Xenorhabdus budapestensis]|uniref:Uncharacterized protein n=1 Tax=Xenorhabdus budapestensis TaxID=290110 RepID=A0A2D0J1A0_XENBU|nr:hypothetical protein [Xenorhabdus budapestensis]PHM28053.1 hypothetical protein Xbud_01782 [Xenorhabdus budapestensis]